MRRRRGFSLLEVLMAVALFGAVVTIILSAQAGLVASDRTATNMSQAIEVGRCRMSEIEEKQLKLGYPEMEEKDQGPLCCNERETPGFTCEWRVERVLLPQPIGLSGDAGVGSILGGGLDLDAGMMSGAGGMPTSLASPAGTVLVNPMGGATLDLDAGLQNIGQSLTQSFGGAGAGAGMSGLLSLVFGIVYPSLKPMLEAAIRRVTVVVHWTEGRQERDFTLQQYITNPSRAGLLAAVGDAGAFADGGGVGAAMLGGVLPGAAGPGAAGMAPGMAR